MISAGRQFIGIGIDIVSWRRIKIFLAHHSLSAICRLLTPSEREIFEKATDQLRSFGQFFSAKEAYFKACGGQGLGEEGLRGIETFLRDVKRFQAFSPFFDPEGLYEGEGEFFETPDGLGAKVFLWKRAGKAG